MSLFYILYSKSIDSYYLGATTEIISERLRRHNSQHKKGFTNRATDWEVVHIEEYATKSEAFNREKEVKAWKSRKRVVELIGKNKV